jgi:hypothetical protein
VAQGSLKAVAVEVVMRLISLIIAVFFAVITAPPASAQMQGQPAHSFVAGSEWYCVSGYRKAGNQCVSIFAEIGGQPAHSFVAGSEWYCVSGYRKAGNQCVSIFASNPSSSSADAYSASGVPAPVAVPCAENGSCYGDISAATGRAKTVPVQGYYRRDGTYVRGHYRSKGN